MFVYTDKTCFMFLSEVLRAKMKNPAKTKGFYQSVKCVTNLLKL